jgi:hypothetical protein
MTSNQLRVDFANEMRHAPSLLEITDSVERGNFLTSYAKDHNQSSGNFIPLCEGWSILRDYGLRALFDVLTGDKRGLGNPFPAGCYSGLVSISYTMCSNSSTGDCSGAVYDLVIEEIQQFLRDRVAFPLLNPSLVGISMIGQFSQAWEICKDTTKWVAYSFRTLDCGNVYDGAGDANLPITGKCMLLFREIAFSGTCEVIGYNECIYVCVCVCVCVCVLFDASCSFFPQPTVHANNANCA